MGEHSKEAKLQAEFVQWLKDEGIYNEYDTAITMQKMYAVWKRMRPAPHYQPVIVGRHIGMKLVE